MSNKFKIYEEVKQEIKERAFQIGQRNGKHDNWEEAEKQIEYKYSTVEVHARGEVGR